MALKLIDSKSVEITTVATPISSLVTIDSEIRELGIKVETNDTIFWAMKSPGAVLDKQPITDGLLLLPVNASIANQITLIAAANTDITIIQIKQ